MTREGQFRGQKSRGPLKMSREMAHKIIVPQKKIWSQSFLNSGTLVFLCTRVLLCTVVVCCCLLLGVLVCCCMLEEWGGLLVAMLCVVLWVGGCYSYIRFEEKHSTDEEKHSTGEV